MIIKNLTETNVQEITAAFNKAFSDYEIVMTMTVERMEAMLQCYGFDAEVSMGAFEDGELVGFVLNALRTIDGVLCAYDCGTGVAPEFRKRGITTALVAEVKKALRQRDAKRYMLEVLKNNTSAFELYKKQGFVVSRELECYEAQASLDKITNQGIEILRQSELSDEQWSIFSGFWDIKPTWQNSPETIRAGKNFSYTVAYAANEPVGYGIVSVKGGRIPQLAVKKTHRNKSVGRVILFDLQQATEAERLAIINVDAAGHELIGFLSKHGFTRTVGQYEMIMEL